MTSKKDKVYTILWYVNALILIWLSTRLINEFFFFLFEKIRRDSEAFVTTSILCDSKHASSMTGLYVNCEAARIWNSSRRLTMVYAFDKAVTKVLHDCWSNAKLEIFAITRLVCLIVVTLCTMAYVVSHIISLGSLLKRNKQMYGETLFEATGLSGGKIPVSTKAGGKKDEFDGVNFKFD